MTLEVKILTYEEHQKKRDTEREILEEREKKGLDVGRWVDGEDDFKDGFQTNWLFILLW